MRASLVTRAGARAQRRLTSAATVRAPLAPPYHHQMRSALAPPYAHAVPAQESARLRAPYTFTIPQVQKEAKPAPAEWIASVLATPEGRAWAQKEWDAALDALAAQAAIPEVQFRQLASADFEAVKASGSVVIRDVIQDAVAEAWATEYAAQGVHPTYYHSTLIAARSDPSILSATNIVLQKVLGVEPAYVRVDTVSHTPSEIQWTGDKVWAAQPAEGTYMPLHAHVAFNTTDLGVPASSHAALYTLLRPYFSAKASRISFYNGAQYLAKENWELSSKPDASAEPVHLKPALVKLNPGDMLVSHAGLPLQAVDAAGLLLPIHPLPACEGNKAFVTLQRTAFEAGLPPPHAIRDGEACPVEEQGGKDEIDSVAGRRAMGYE